MPWPPTATPPPSSRPRTVADQINTDTSSDTNYYAVVNTTGANPTLQIFATGGSTYSVTTSARGAATAPTTANGGGASTFSMGDVINAINGAGTAAQGVVSMTSDTGGSLTINEVHTINWTAQGSIGADLAYIADHISGPVNGSPILKPLVTARVDGTQLIVTANSTGSQFDYTMSGVGAGVVVASPTMHGGSATTVSTGVVAATNLNSDGSTSLVLERNSTGANQTLNIATTDTLGTSEGSNFALWNQTSYAASARGSPTTETKGERTFAFNFSGATANQMVTVNFAPDSASASTSSAGDSQTFYLYQNGAPQGTLQSLSIAKDAPSPPSPATAPWRPWGPWCSPTSSTPMPWPARGTPRSRPPWPLARR